MSANRNIRSLAGLRKVSGDFGIEVEVEGTNLPGNRSVPNGFFDVWSVEHDGSLRGESFEYVLRTPTDIKGVDKALEVLSKAYKECSSNVSVSVRCGVHVHINCQELNIKQVMTFATLYYTLEELLLMYCNESRRGNHFCLRAKDAEFLIYTLNQNLKSGVIRSFNNDNLRYSSLNFCSLPKFGSLEFRSLESPRKLEKISSWASILLQIKNISLTFDDPIDVITSMSNNGYEGFVRHVLGEHYDKFEKVDDMDSLIISGVRNAQSLAFSNNWKEVEDMWNKVRARRSSTARRENTDEMIERIVGENTNRPPPFTPNTIEEVLEVTDDTNFIVHDDMFDETEEEG